MKYLMKYLMTSYDSRSKPQMPAMPPSLLLSIWTPPPLVSAPPKRAPNTSAEVPFLMLAPAALPGVGAGFVQALLAAAGGGPRARCCEDWRPEYMSLYVPELMRFTSDGINFEEMHLVLALMTTQLCSLQFFGVDE